MAPTAAADMTRSDVRRWTDEDISTLVSMWPTSTTAQIAMRLQRPCGAIREKAKRLCKKGLLDGKNAPRCQSIKPDPQDFDEVKSNYCRKNHVTIAELCARFERDNQLASELYRLALAAKLTRLRSREADSCD
jgi:hypothetical protein